MESSWKKSKGGKAIKKETIRINEEIKSSQVRVIGSNGEQVGIVPIAEALALAEKQQLDLVEVAANADPPVCRVMDFGKYKYQLSKKEKLSRKKQHVIHVKEIRFRPTIDDHDIAFKVKQGRKFIDQGNHLRIRVLFKGRQIIHPELGQQVLERIKSEFEDIAKMETEPVSENRSIVVTFVPK